MTKDHFIGAATAIGLFAATAAWSQVPTTTPPAPAAPTIPAQPSQTSTTTPSADWRKGLPTDQQIADAVNARIAVLKADLRLSGEQQGHWGQLETALRETAIARSKQRMEREARAMAEREEFREQMRRWRDEQRNRAEGTPRGEPPQRPWQMSDLEGMKAQAQVMAARATEMQRIADAASPLYTTLDERQRRMLMDGMRQVGEQRMGRRGGGRDGRWHEDDHGDRDGRGGRGDRRGWRE